MSYQQNSGRYPTQDESSRPVAIRAGLSVQELKLMTAMRMAQNQNGDHSQQQQQASPFNHSGGHHMNPSSSYQTANPQQLRAAGIQPVVINDRNSRGRHGRSLQLAGQFSAEQFSSSSGNSANLPISNLNRISGPSTPQQYQLPALNSQYSQDNDRNRFPQVHASSSRQRHPGYRQQQLDASISVDSLLSEFENFSPSQRQMPHHHEQNLLGRLAPPSTRSNSLASLSQPTPVTCRSSIQSGGHPEVLSNEDEFSPRISTPVAYPGSNGTLLDDWQGSRKVAMLKSRSEALFAPDQLALFQQQLQQEEAMRLLGLPSSAESILESQNNGNGMMANVPLSSPQRSRFPLLKSKTVPKISPLQQDFPLSGSPTPKLLGRKKLSSVDIFLASEVAEAVLDSAPLDLATAEDLSDARQQQLFQNNIINNQHAYISQHLQVDRSDFGACSINSPERSFESNNFCSQKLNSLLDVAILQQQSQCSRLNNGDVGF